MKIEEVKTRIMQAFLKNEKITAQELHYTPYNIPFVQSYGILAHLVEIGAVTKVDKAYSLIDSKKAQLILNVDTQNKTTSVKVDKGGRDNTKYKFNGQEYGKSRLALAIISFYVKKKKPTYAQLCEIFPIKLIPPYGLIKPKVEALEVSMDRARFFIKEHEVLVLSDGPVCVSNQLTKDRIEKLIKIAQDDLGYDIN